MVGDKYKDVKNWTAFEISETIPGKSYKTTSVCLIFRAVIVDYHKHRFPWVRFSSKTNDIISMLEGHQHLGQVREYFSVQDVVLLVWRLRSLFLIKYWGSVVALYKPRFNSNAKHTWREFCHWVTLFTHKVYTLMFSMWINRAINYWMIKVAFICEPWLNYTYLLL